MTKAEYQCAIEEAEAHRKPIWKWMWPWFWFFAFPPLAALFGLLLIGLLFFEEEARVISGWLARSV